METTWALYWWLYVSVSRLVDFAFFICVSALILIAGTGAFFLILSDGRPDSPEKSAAMAVLETWKKVFFYIHTNINNIFIHPRAR